MAAKVGNFEMVSCLVNRGQADINAICNVSIFFLSFHRLIELFLKLI